MDRLPSPDRWRLGPAGSPGFSASTLFCRAREHGRAPIPLIRQSDISPFKKYVENARWDHGGVGLMTAHVVGSYNNSEQRNVTARKEFAERDKSSSTWISEGFVWARGTGKKGLVVFIHADPLRGRDHDRKIGRPSKRTLSALTKGALDFKKPVLLVHGDFHSTN